MDPAEEIKALKAALRELKLQHYHLYNVQRHRAAIAWKREKDAVRQLRRTQKQLQKAKKLVGSIRDSMDGLSVLFASLIARRPMRHIREALATSREWEEEVPKKAARIDGIQREEDETEGLEVPFLAPTVDVVICIHNALDDVKQCLASLLEHSPRMQLLVLVNDGSDEATTAYLEEFAQSVDRPVEIVHNREAQGYTIAANQGVKLSRADYTVLLNSDTIVTHYWLESLVLCGESDPKIGIIGPLSNAASWQSVPERFGEDGDWEVNELPPGITPDDLATQLLLNHEPSYPKVSLINGFCYVIKRAVFNKIGWFDEETFPKGYGEENDFSLRAVKAGFKLAIADNAYVFHAKSKSFTHEKRRVLSKNATQLLHGKHDESIINEACEVLRNDPDMAKAREAVAKLQHEKVPFRVLYVLDFKGDGGGTHSIAQEVQGLCERGIFAQMAVPQAFYDFYREKYPTFSSTRFYTYQTEYELVDAAGAFDVVVATLFTSVDLLARIQMNNPKVIPGYYIQDYEPMFYEEGTPLYNRAKRSYGLIPNVMAFAKTPWLCQTLKEKEGLDMQLVTPSIDHTVYYPKGQPEQGPLIVTAMVRPSTPRRSPELTVEVLKQLKEELSDKIRVVVFGCPQDDPFWDRVDTDWQFEKQGILRRKEVAKILRGASANHTA